MTNLCYLIAAIILVESSGDNRALGDYKNGEPKAFGPMQIQNVCREDVNRFARTQFTRNDCFSRGKSIQMFRLYIGYYATEDRLGRAPTLEDYSRIWNGGPTGWRKPSTLDYWEKVKLELWMPHKEALAKYEEVTDGKSI